MKPSSYWDKRAEYRENLTVQKAKAAEQKLATAYQKATRDLQTEIDKIYDTYAAKGGFSISEAKKVLSVAKSQQTLDMLREQINGISDPAIRRQLMSRINAPAYQYRINRLQALQESVNIKLAQVADYEIDTDTQTFVNVINDEYYRHIYDMQRGSGYGFSFTALDSQTTNRVLGYNWSGSHYSSRVWANTTQLANEINSLLLSGMEAGRSRKAMADELAEVMGVGSYEAARLVHTESAFMHSEADKAAYAEADVEEYEFLSVLDKRTSKGCRKLDNKRFPLAKAQTGVNYPPMHPWCRSTTRMALDPEVTKDWKRRARNPITGETELVPYNMSYEDWQKKNSISAKGLNLFGGSSKIKLNKANDIRSLTKYAKQTLGATNVNLRGLDPKAVKGTFRQMEKAIEQYPQLKGSILEIGKIPKGNKSIMDCVPIDVNMDKYRLRFSTAYYGDIKQLKASAKRNKSDYWISGAKWNSAGVHELGHVMNGLAIRANTPISERADDWNDELSASVITEKAWQSTRHLYPRNMDIDAARQRISTYATGSYSETVAEAFHDTIMNGDKAQPISLTIVDYLNILTR